MPKRFTTCNKRMKAQPVIYLCDFETFTDQVDYYMENNDTAVYAAYAVKANIKYDWNKIKPNGEKGMYGEYTNFKPLEKGFVGIKEYIDFFTKHRMYGTLQYHYFHNYTKFDSRFLESYLKEYGWKNHGLIESLNVPDLKDVNYKHNHYVISNMDNKIKTLTLTVWLGEKEKVVIEFRDSILFWPKVSIKEMGVSLVRKGIMEQGKFNLDFNLAKHLYSKWEDVPIEIQNRVRYDCLILAKWFELHFNTMDFIANGSEIKLTISSISMSHWLSWWANKTGIHKGTFLSVTGIDAKDQDEINEYFIRHRLYSGGVSSGEAQEIKDTNMWWYDVNSLYPSVMRGHLHPYGTMKKSKRVPKDLNGKVVFVKARFKWIKQLRRDVPPFLSTKRTFDINRVRKPFQHYLYEARDYEFCENLELYRLYEKYFNFEIESIEYLIFEGRDYFTEWLDPIIKHKEQLKSGDPERDYEKLRMNSVYGKFCERAERRIRVDSKLRPYYKQEWDIEHTDADGIDTIMFYESSKTSFFPIGTNITSLARLTLIGTIMEHSGATYYCDTDSMVTNQEINPTLIHDSEVGKWSIDPDKDIGNQLNVLRAKCYIYANEDKLLKIKSSGANPNEIGIEKYGDFVSGHEYKMLQRVKLGSGYVLQQVTKTLMKTKD